MAGKALRESATPFSPEAVAFLLALGAALDSQAPPGEREVTFEPDSSIRVLGADTPDEQIALVTVTTQGGFQIDSLAGGGGVTGQVVVCMFEAEGVIEVRLAAPMSACLGERNP